MAALVFTHWAPWPVGVPSPWLHSRVVSVDGASAGGAPLDGLHCSGVEGLLLGHGPLLVAAALRSLHLSLPLRLVHVVNAEQQTVVHDLEALQHLSTRGGRGGVG